MGHLFKSTAYRRYIYISIVLLVSYTSLMLISSYIIRTVLVAQVRQTLTKLGARIEHDLEYQNEKWDTTLYNADPETPHPTGSSGFVNPLYIVTTTGFVIERNRPMQGLLDTSDYKRLLTFNNAQTINAITNERWRVLSRTIMKNDTILGVIMVSSYNPLESSTEIIDEKLKINLDTIAARLKISGNMIDTSALDIRDVDYDISFEIVDTFNKVLANNGRTPSFIDPSYVDKIMRSDKETIYIDERTHEKFLTIRTILYDDQKIPRAVVVAGESIDFVNKGQRSYLPYALTAVIIVLITSLGLIIKIINSPFDSNKQAHTAELPKSIRFNSQNGQLSLDKTMVEFPIDSHQHKILRALCSEPNKVWTQQELLAFFQEENNQANGRKTYDAMLAINKKLPIRLIKYKEKTYWIDPDFTSVVSIG